MKYMLEKVQRSDIYQNIMDNGYCELANPYLTKGYYRKLYHCFNNLATFIANQQSFSQTLSEIEKNFLTLYTNVFAGVPAGYRDCVPKIGKKDQKSYFQYSKEYHRLIKEKYPQTLNRFAFFKLFLSYLENIYIKAEFILNNAIHSLGKNVPYLEEALFGNRKSLTIIIRVLRYIGNQSLCTSPHYDKSGLTLGLDNNDINDDVFIIGPYQDPFKPASLCIPKRQLSSSPNVTSALLFPGACLRAANLPLNPSPHAALPAKSSLRYALIAFCLVPNINTQAITTTIMDKNEFAKMRKFATNSMNSDTI